MIARCRIGFRLGRAYYCETRAAAMQQHIVNESLLEPESRSAGKECFQSKSPVNGLSKSYDETIQALMNLESNSSIIDKSLNKTPELLRRKADRLIGYLEKFSITLDDLNRLNIIHIAGTKGKGSTCAFVEAILRQKGFKTGLFTSPHLITVRERIKINGKPISVEKFCENFWTMHDKLAGSGSMPGFFMYTTLMGFYHFIKEQVDVLILETGLGGEFDCTNIITKPVVIGITSLGMDHMNVLGDSLKSIAWHKAGIMKSHAIGVTVPQNPIAMEVIKERSIEKACPIYLSQPEDSLDTVALGIEGNVQKINASLAIHLSRLWQNKVADHKNEIFSNFNLQSKPLDEDELTALKQTRWPGRCQLVKTKFIDFFLDGAHTEESMENCLDWFNSKSQYEAHQASGRTIRGLLFSSTGKRQYAPLLKIIAKESLDFAIFAPPRIDPSGQYEEMKDWRLDKNDVSEKFRAMQNYWDDLNCANGMKVTKSHHCNTLLQSMELLESPQTLLNEELLPITKEDRLHILVTGSLLLVGRVMKIIESCPINFST